MNQMEKALKAVRQVEVYYACIDDNDNDKWKQFVCECGWKTFVMPGKVAWCFDCHTRYDTSLSVIKKVYADKAWFNNEECEHVSSV